MHRWIDFGIFERIWALLIEECDELGGVSFEWQSVSKNSCNAVLGTFVAALGR